MLQVEATLQTVLKMTTLKDPFETKLLKFTSG